MPGVIRKDGIWCLSCYEKKLYHLSEGVEGTFDIEKNSTIYPYGPLNDVNAFYLTIVVNNICNLKCPYCSLGRKNGEVIKSSFVINFVQRMFDTLHFKKYYFAFFGGEPTLDPEVIRRVCDGILSLSDTYKVAVRFTLTTNGTFSSEMLEIFKDYQISVLLSMDGNKEIQDRQRSDSFDIVDKNLTMLVSNNVDFNVTSVVTAYSVDYWLENCVYFYNKGIKNWNYNPVFNYPWGEKRKEFLRPLAEQYIESAFNVFKYGVEHGCKYSNPVYARLFRPTRFFCDLQVHSQSLLLNYNGDILCCAEVQTDEHPFYNDVKLGNVYLDYSFRDLLNYSHYPDLNSKCNSCSLKHVCCGGCINRNRLLGKEFDEYNCEVFRGLTYKMIEYLIDCKVKK